MDKNNSNHAEIFKCADQMNSQKTKKFASSITRLQRVVFLEIIETFCASRGYFFVGFCVVIVVSDGFRSTLRSSNFSGGACGS